MTKIISRKLPNAISYTDVGDPIVQRKVMLLKENIASLSAQLAELQRATIELQNRPTTKQKEIEDLEGYVAAAAASATAAATSASSALRGVELAERAAGNAGESEYLAERSKESAKASQDSAEQSKIEAQRARTSADNLAGECLAFRNEAQSARDVAVQAKEEAVAAATEAKFQTVAAFYGVDLGANVYRRIFLSDFRADTERSYRVIVRFINGYSTAVQSCVVWKNTASTKNTDGFVVSVPGYSGTTPGEAEVEFEMTGDDYLRIDNLSATIDVVVKFIVI